MKFYILTFTLLEIFVKWHSTYIFLPLLWARIERDAWDMGPNYLAHDCYTAVCVTDSSRLICMSARSHSGPFRSRIKTLDPNLPPLPPGDCLFHLPCLHCWFLSSIRSAASHFCCHLQLSSIAAVNALISLPPKGLIPLGFWSVPG